MTTATAARWQGRSSRFPTMAATDLTNRCLWVVVSPQGVHAAHGLRTYSWPANYDDWQEFARMADSAECIFIYSPSQRDALSQCLPPALYASLQNKIEDVAPMAVVVWPCLPHCRWPIVLSALGIADAHQAQALRRLTQFLVDAVQALPEDLRSVLGAVLGPQARPRWLQWPRESLSPAGLHAVLMRLLAEKPLVAPRPLVAMPASDLPDTVADLFQPNGSLASAHPRFEYRESQKNLAVAVARALTQEEILIAEAGTGTGKSLGYLVPVALWSRALREPVLVATYTRNLQDQLYTQEIPLLRKVLGRDVTATVVKGRSNYACVRLTLRFIEEAAQSLMPGERWAAAFMASWLVQAEQADLEAISPEAAEIIPELSIAIVESKADYWRCTRQTATGCRERHVCALRRLRICAARSEVVITNQAMLLADLSRDMLPDYRNLVIDEAHHLEEAATNALTLEVSSYLLWQTGRLMAAETGGTDVSTALSQAATRLGDTAERWATEAGSWVDRAAQWQTYSEELGNAVLELLGGSSAQTPHEPRSKRVTEEVRDTREWVAVEGQARMVQQMAQETAAHLYAIAKELQAQAEIAQVDVESQVSDVVAAATALTDVNETLQQILDDDPGRVVWVEAVPDPRNNRWALYSAPVDVTHALNDMLFGRCRSVVLTGATISVDGSFDFYRQQCGLDEQSHRVVEMMLPSPFDWQRQLLLCLPTDLPDPGAEEHDEVVIETIAQLARISGGGLLVLFTARQRMLAAYEALRQRLDALGLPVLCQDVSGERWWLLEHMRADERTVLLGVRSLWEGVDVPGQNLRCVLVEKLPFAVPDDPRVAARMEYLAKLGVDPYQNYYVPAAIRALRQGVGRLVRTSTDKGVVFLMDARIHHRAYGRRFISSLPPATKITAELAECLAAAAEWFSEGG